MKTKIETLYLQKCLEADLEAAGIESIQKHFQFRCTDQIVDKYSYPSIDDFISALKSAITDNGGKVIRAFYKEIRDRNGTCYDFIFDYYGNFKIKTSTTWIDFFENIDEIVIVKTDGTNIHPYRELKERHVKKNEISSCWTRQYVSDCALAHLSI